MYTCQSLDIDNGPFTQDAWLVRFAAMKVVLKVGYPLSPRCMSESSRPTVLLLYCAVAW